MYRLFTYMQIVLVVGSIGDLAFWFPILSFNFRSSLKIVAVVFWINKNRINHLTIKNPTSFIYLFFDPVIILVNAALSLSTVLHKDIRIYRFPLLPKINPGVIKTWLLKSTFSVSSSAPL